MTEGIGVSIVICTFNRAVLVKDAIDSFFKMDFPTNLKFELVIVNNNSTDDTEKIVFEIKKRRPVKYVFEPFPGLSLARNRGISESKGNIIAFVDDDIFFDRLWLKNLALAFEEFPLADGLAGRIEAVFESPRPAWLTDSRLEHHGFGATRFGSCAKRIQFPEYPHGGNMAFRRQALVSTTGFSENLGRRPNSLLSNEEKEFFIRFEKMGFKVVYCPSSLIQHRIQKSRMTRRWIINRFYWQGVSDAVMNNSLSSPCKKVLLKNVGTYSLKILYELVGKNVNPLHLIKFIFKLSLERMAMIAFNLGLLKQTIRFLIIRRRN